LQRHGLLASFDSGKTWQRLNDPLAEGYFPLVRANNSGSILAVSATEGVFTLDSSARSSNAVGTSSLMLGTNGAQKPR